MKPEYIEQAFRRLDDFETVLSQVPDDLDAQALRKHLEETSASTGLREADALRNLQLSVDVDRAAMRVFYGEIESRTDEMQRVLGDDGPLYAEAYTLGAVTGLIVGLTAAQLEAEQEQAQ